MEKYLICKKDFSLPWQHPYKFEEGKSYKYIEIEKWGETKLKAVYVYYDYFENDYLEKRGHTFYYQQENKVVEYFYIDQELRRLKLEKLNEKLIQNR